MSLLTDSPRILLTRMMYIGDIVLTTPAIRAVREAFPGAFIAYLGEKNSVELLEGNPHLDRIIPFDFSRPAILEQPRVVRQLRQLKFDASVDFFGNPRSAFLTYLSGAHIRIGGDFRGRGRLFTTKVPDDGVRRTSTAFHLRYLEPLGISVEHPHSPELFVSAHKKGSAFEFLTQQGIDVRKRIIGLHPSATWPAKMWPKEHFVALARGIVKRTGAQVLFTQGPKDGELISYIKREADGLASILPTVPLQKLSAILSTLDVFVSNDCGPMHVAAAVGTKTVGIFGPGEEDIWFPYQESKGHITVRHDVPCHPCHLDFCNRSGDDFMACMKGVTVEQVLQLVEERLR